MQTTEGQGLDGERADFLKWEHRRGDCRVGGSSARAAPIVGLSILLMIAGELDAIF
jgi:hypothetical protein